MTKSKDVKEDGDLIVPEPMALAIPMMPIEELKKLTAYVNNVKKTLMTAGKDYVIDGSRQYTARSGFAKLHQGFFLSDGHAEIKTLYYEEPQEFEFTHRIRRKDKTEKITTKIYGFEAYVTVINVSTGRHASGEGACTVEELHQTNNMSPKWYHRCLGTAKTRAWNRAVSNYVGSAEVSAEEMGLVYDTEEPKRKKVESEQVISAQSEGPVLITSASGMEAYLEDNGIDPGLVEIVDEGEVLVMTPKQYLETEWMPINNLVRDARGSWERVDGANNYWRIPLAEDQEEKPQVEQPQEPQQEEEPEFNPFAATSGAFKNIEEIEYILDSKFPGAKELFAVTEDARCFTVEPMKILDPEVVEEAKSLLRGLGGEYREVSGNIGYMWLIKKQEADG